MIQTNICNEETPESKDSEKSFNTPISNELILKCKIHKDREITLVNKEDDTILCLECLIEKSKTNPNIMSNIEEINRISELNQWVSKKIEIYEKKKGEIPTIENFGEIEENIKSLTFYKTRNFTESKSKSEIVVTEKKIIKITKNLSDIIIKFNYKIEEINLIGILKKKFFKKKKKIFNLFNVVVIILQ
jgi:hypothetical protein